MDRHQLSVIIPSYKEPHLQQTINSLRENADGPIEIIAVLDGYHTPITGATVLELPHGGTRNAINKGVALSRGEYIMKTDGHCMFAKGFDTALLSHIDDNWVVVPRRYKLDVEKWERTDDRAIDYEKLIIHPDYHKFHAEDWKYRTAQRQNIPLDETMLFQGSCWLMKRDWFEELDDQNYGTFTMEPLEIGMRTYERGGKLMVNKSTWYAHRHRDFNRTWRPDTKEIERGNAYALQRWMPQYEKLTTHFNI